MELDQSVGGAGRGLVNAGEFGPAVFSGAFGNVARVFGFGSWADADRIVADDGVVFFDGFVGVGAPENARHHTAARGGDVFGAAPGREAIILTGRNRKSFLPPTIETRAVVIMDNQRAVAGFAAGREAFEARANFIARSLRGPIIDRGS